ncbi:MAG: hypothetical protein IPK83_15350 [Planctomycetes bacterium]|nr:hypothetical protein [Planctomycetota bacterium]
MTELASQLEGVANYNVAVHEQLRPDGSGRDVVFLHKIVPGAADRSYGVHVAAMAGMPASIVKRAETILADLEQRFERGDGASKAGRRVQGNPNQLMLFGEPEPLPAWWSELVDALGSIDVNRMTPIEALGALQGLKTILQKPR